MNNFEAKKLFEKKINEACEVIKNTKNGDMLTTKISYSYIDDYLREESSYNGKDDTTLVASAVVYEKNHTTEEDPTYEITLLCDLKRGDVKNPTELATELESFDAELQRFTTALSSAENVFKFISDEDQRITAEGEKIVANLQKSAKKMKIGGLILGIGLFAIIFIFTLLK